MTEHVARQFQVYLDNIFHSGFRPGLGAEKVLAALAEDLLLQLDKGTTSLVILLGYFPHWDRHVVSPLLLWLPIECHVGN